MEEFRFGQFALGTVGRTLTRRGEIVPLGSRAVDILMFLASEPGVLRSNEEIMQHAWPNTFVDQANLRVHMSAIRKALGDTRTDPQFIANVPGRGYRFVAEVERVAAPASIVRTPRPTGIFGREGAILAIARLMDAGLVTVVGPGGIGKSTVARAVISHLGAGPRAIWMDLAELASGTLLRSSVATALGIPSNDPDNLETIVTTLVDHDRILVLDNCEHIVDDVAALVEALRDRLPFLTIIATSREPLRVATERIFRLPPLDVPPADITPENALVTSAMQLFMDRAAAQLGDIEVAADDANHVAEICRRLDGIPLAIELAAARLESISLGELSASVMEGFRLLTNGRRIAVPRHRTLRAALDWSYDALTPEQQSALQRLSVLRGWFSFPTACGVLGELPHDALHELVSKSLIVADRQGVVTRYRVLEMTRHYGHEKLRDAGCIDDAMTGLTDFLIATLETADASQPFFKVNPHLAELLPNLRVALSWCMQHDPSRAVVLTVASVPLFLRHSLLHECLTHVGWGVAFLDAHPGLDERRRMQLYATLVWPQIRTAQHEDVVAARTAFTIAERLGDVDYQLRALWALWVNALNQAQPLQALRLANAFAQQADLSSDPVDRVVGLRLVGATLHWLGRFAESQDHLRRMLGGYFALPSHASLIRFQFDQRISAHVIMTRNLWIMGEEDAALNMINETILLAAETGHELSLANYLAEAACLVALLAGQIELAEQFIVQLRQHARRLALDVWDHYADCFDANVHFYRGDIAGCVALMDKGCHALTGESLLLFDSYFRAVHAGAMSASGRHDEAISLLDSVLSECRLSGQRWCVAELYRIKAGVVTSQAAAGWQAQASGLLSTALREARADGAKAWEVRAQDDLDRLSQRPLVGSSVPSA